MDEFLTVAQAAEVLGVHRTAVNDAVKAGKLPTVSVMGKRAIRRSDLGEYRPRNYSGRSGRSGRSDSSHRANSVQIKEAEECS